MPSAFTAPVADGKITTLRDFAMLCARGMGATIMMRDEPFDKPIPEAFEPSNYHAEKLAEATERLRRLKALSSDEIIAEAAKWNKENDAFRADRVAKNTETRARYDAMRQQVEAWEGAPDGIKQFMLEQLTNSREFDTEADPLKYTLEPRKPMQWWAAECESAAKNIEYHTREDAAERKRTEERNAWLAQLRASLP